MLRAGAGAVARRRGRSRARRWARRRDLRAARRDALRGHRETHGARWSWCLFVCGGRRGGGRSLAVTSRTLLQGVAQARVEEALSVHALSDAPAAGGEGASRALPGECVGCARLRAACEAAAGEMAARGGAVVVDDASLLAEAAGCACGDGGGGVLRCVTQLHSLAHESAVSVRRHRGGGGIGLNVAPRQRCALIVCAHRDTDEAPRARAGGVAGVVPMVRVAGGRAAGGGGGRRCVQALYMAGLAEHTVEVRPLESGAARDVHGTVSAARPLLLIRAAAALTCLPSPQLSLSSAVRVGRPTVPTLQLHYRVQEFAIRVFRRGDAV